MARKTSVFTKSPTYENFGDISNEMLRIQEAFNQLSLYSATEESHEPPAKVVNLQVVYADGVNWDPGKGAWLYIRVGTQWKRIVTE